MESILNFDRSVFDLINQGLSNPFFDTLLPLMREHETWIPLYILVIVGLGFAYKLKMWMPLIALVATVALCDQVSSNLIKKSVKRPRPCHVVEQYPQTIVRVGCGGGYSFTSSHATNHFGMALFIPFVLGWRQKWVPGLFFAWAGLICLSQVYVGVHYPIDVTCGALLGLLIAYSIKRLYLRLGGPIQTLRFRKNNIAKA